MVYVKLQRRRRRLRTLSFVSLSVLLPFLLWWRGGSGWRPLPNRDIPPRYSDDLPACLAIITGNIEGKKGDLERLLNSRKRRVALSEEFYLNETADCRSYVARRGFVTEPLSAEERDFPIAYSIVIYHNVEMFERLLRAIYNPQNVYCVHVDRKSAGKFLRTVEAIISCLPNVFLASKLERVVYASWSRVQADLNCMRDLLASHVQWKYLINTCGMDFPIKTNRDMVQALKLLNGRNSMESEGTSYYKKLRWTYRHIVTDTVTRTEQAKSPPPIKSPMFAGSAYFVVTRSFVRHVLRDPEIETFLEWEKDTYSPDEHLWATLQRMPSVPGSSPANEKYHQSDMNALPRAVKWSYLEGTIEEGAPYTACTGTYRRAVCVYGAGDLPWLLQRHQLFANKFDPEVDDVVIRCLESVLYFKALGQDLPLTERYL